MHRFSSAYVTHIKEKPNNNWLIKAESSHPIEFCQQQEFFRPQQFSTSFNSWDEAGKNPLIVSSQMSSFSTAACQKMSNETVPQEDEFVR